MGTWGQQPRGIFAADEKIRPGKVDPSHGFETCGMTEFAKSFYLLGRITGDPCYADQCEDIMLNHFPAAQTPDLKGLHYITASNCPQLDASTNHDFQNERGRKEAGRNPSAQLPFSPHGYRCCQHNVAMGWPWYAQYLWQATSDSGLVAWMYAASAVTAKVGRNGQEVSIESETDYPFKGTVHMAMATSQPVEFPLYLRVPRWCRKLRVTLNGKKLDVCGIPQTYLCIERVWSNGDTLDLDMPMQISITEWPRNGSVTVDRGPLSYSVRIEEEWKRCGGTEEWPQWEVIPTTPWNYGLDIDRQNPTASLRVEEKGIKDKQPWTVESAPVEISADAKRIPEWGLEDETVQQLLPSPILSHEKKERIRMIPLGCARLRMSCLPVIGNAPEAQRWHRSEN